MMTVRFDTGFSLQYNNACYIQWAASTSDFHTLYDQKDGNLIAKVPGTTLIEWVVPCRAYNHDSDLGQRLTLIEKDLRSIYRKLPKRVIQPKQEKK